MARYRVLVVDDSPFMRQVFSDFIATAPEFEVAGIAANGQEAVERALELEPDVITMDLEMPLMNGLEALQKIMSVRPTPVIMVSAVTDNGTRDTIRALQYGAVDFIRKPGGSVKQEIGNVGEQLRELLHMIAEMAAKGNFRWLPAVEEHAALVPEPHAEATPAMRSKASAIVEAAAGETASGRETPPAAASSSPRAAAEPPEAPPRRLAKPAGRETAGPAAAGPAKTGRRADAAPPSPAAPAASAPPMARPAKRPAAAAGPEAEQPREETPGRTAFEHLVAIGTSTGGPRALHEVLTGIPADFPAPILVVQHMPPKFTNSLAQRLDSFARIRVREAQDGEIVRSGTAYIAPGGRHLTLAGAPSGEYRIVLTDEEPRSGHRPSVDRLFESLIGFRELKRHAVLMTGMGSDGAKGMRALLDDGAESTIAESEDTCIVYGMPRSAVELGAAKQVVPLQQIAQALVREVSVRKR